MVHVIDALWIPDPSHGDELGTETNLSQLTIVELRRLIQIGEIHSRYARSEVLSSILGLVLILCPFLKIRTCRLGVRTYLQMILQSLEQTMALLANRAL